MTFLTGRSRLSPFIGVNYDRLDLDGFMEQGAGALNLTVAEQTAKSLRSVLGTKISHQFKDTDTGISFVPFASAGWQHEYIDQSRTMLAQFTSSGGAFTVQTAEASKNGLLASAGADLNHQNGFSFRVHYIFDLRSDFNSKTIGASVRYRF
jgi:outer membrane lipase/esterase